jgi:hypothetical protein
MAAVEELPQESASYQASVHILDGFGLPVVEAACSFKQSGHSSLENFWAFNFDQLWTDV